MGITNESLDKTPINCGNCIQMSVVGRRGSRRVAKCVRGRLDDRTYVIDKAASEPPENWNRAFMCPDFVSMIDNLEVTI